MKLFGWVQNKLSGKPVNKKPNTVSALTTKQEAREEFSDWPQGLLAIGTFGNNEIKQESTSEENPSSSSEELEIVDFTAEEVGNLQKELTKLLTRKSNKEKEIAELPLDRFLNCPSSLEVDRRISNALINSIDDSESKSDYKKDEDNIDKTISVIIDKCKDICAKKNNKAIGKKSISFLLKKILVCGSGFSPTTPSLKDPLQESRIEKLLKMMLLKKMKTQNSNWPTAKKYLEDNKQRPRKRINEDDDEKTHDGCKWVKTDSEYIVLEI